MCVRSSKNRASGAFNKKWKYNLLNSFDDNCLRVLPFTCSAMCNGLNIAPSMCEVDFAQRYASCVVSARFGNHEWERWLVSYNTRLLMQAYANV